MAYSEGQCISENGQAAYTYMPPSPGSGFLPPAAPQSSILAPAEPHLPLPGLGRSPTDLQAGMVMMGIPTCQSCSPSC
jgi:hypothetical protein